MEKKLQTAILPVSPPNSLPGLLASAPTAHNSPDQGNGTQGEHCKPAQKSPYDIFDNFHFLAMPGPPGRQRRKDRAVDGPGDPGQWPNILIPSQVERQTSRWARDMSELLDAIPRSRQLHGLIDYYFREVQGYSELHRDVELIPGWYVSVVTIRAEVELFEKTRYTPDRMMVDPAWLAIIAAMIWCVCRCVSTDARVVCHFALDETTFPADLTNLGFTSATVYSLAELMYETFDTALSCTAWPIRPQMRVLQALTVVNGVTCVQAPDVALTSQSFLLLQHRPSDRTQGTCYQTSMVRNCRGVSLLAFRADLSMCKALKLDVSTSLEQLKELDDPALPPSKPLYCVELARRVFSHVLILDTIHSAPMMMQSKPYLPDGAEQGHPLELNPRFILLSSRCEPH